MSNQERIEQTNDEYQNGEDFENNVRDKSLSKAMVFGCYVTALLLVIAIVYGFTGIAADVINNITTYEVDRFKVLAVVGSSYLLWNLMMSLGSFWRSNEKNEIGTAVTNFPNPFYDPGFIKDSIAVKSRYNELLSRFNVSNALLKRSQQNNAQLSTTIEQFESKLRVMLRHNDNSNRLIRSFNYLVGQNDELFIHKMLNDILNECITILEKDQSDKSISLFQLKESKLIIKESVRINAESIAKRSFLQGKGFAGHIWNTKKPEIVNCIEEDDERFADDELTSTPIGSILGYPLIVDENFLGVLCLQSEAEDGFNEADLRTVEFYARMCTLILLYDTINNTKT
ncbi:hypothetical protein COE92_18335 [Bacillus wiedmannii]|uniref:GAF domain-containing protein n=1 Tax=Bacillus wiedmannii TaxID=1890302 RepID=UPI000BFB7D10|nr:GAF domain-containing protein [Bacillus wiedmannii]PHB52891.1 hypothetical protein COE92_18335 [Bacillus wiedmannii]